MTVLSQKPCESITDLFSNDYKRYVMKGLHLVTSAVLMFSYFYYGPELLHSLWKYIIPLGLWKNVFMILTFGFPLGCHIGNMLLYYFTYKLKLPFLEKHRVLNQPWPWEKSQEEWIPYRNRAFKYLFLNLVVCNVTLAFLEYLGGVDHYNYSIETLPSKFEYFWQTVFCMFSEDFFFYFSHRLFHWKPIYRFHKIHHEHFNANCLTPSYTHPVDYVLGSALPFISGFKILGSRCHFSFYFFWTFWRIAETYDGHSGYEFPWAMYRLFPFSGSSDYHNFHHSKNSGNFSSFFTYLDSIFGTNKDYFKFKQSQKKNE